MERQEPKKPVGFNLKRTFLHIGKCAKEAFNGWTDDHATTHAAALSYYTVFSIAPLLLIALALGSYFFGEEALKGQVFGSLAGILGADGASAVEKMLTASAIQDGGTLAGIVGVVLLVVGATTVFGQLQDSLNAIWKVRRKPGKNIATLVRQRVLSFAMILVIAFLMLVSLVLTAGLAAVGTYAQTRLPGGAILWQWVNTVVSFGVVTLLFAALYKILPDVELAWRDVRLGAVVTALLFTLGKFLIGLYLGKSGVASTYGAAGAGVFILLWAYYSSAILLYGAEYTRSHALMRGGEIPLKDGAEWDPTTIGNPSKNPDFAKAVQA